MRATVARYWSIPLLQRLFVGAAWSVAGSGLSRLLTLASTVAVARMLGVEHYGQLAILQSTLGTVGVFAGLGVGVVATKFAAELKVRDPVRLGKILALVKLTAYTGGVLIAAALAVSADVVANRIMNMPALAWMIVPASVSVVFTTADGYNNSALLGFEAVKQSVLCGLAASLLSIPVSIALIWVYGLQGAVGGLVLASILQWAASRWMLGRVLRTHNIKYGPLNLQEWKMLRDYALPAMLGGAMVVPAHWLCHVMLVNTPGGTVEMGVLAIGFQWFQAVYFIPLAFGRTVLPVLTDTVAGGHSQNVRTVLKSAIIANTLLAVPMALLIGLCSRWMMQLYGINDASASLALSLMVAAAALSAASAPVGLVMVAKGNFWQGWLMNLGWAATYIGVSYCLLKFGAAGVAAGLLTAYVLHTAWVSTWVRWNFNMLSARQ